MLVLTVILAALLQQNPQAATIEGMVVRAGTNFPIAGTRIRAIPDASEPLEAVTDGAGRFVLRDVPAGRVRIEAHAEGYLFLVRLSGGATLRDADGTSRTADGYILPSPSHRQTVSVSTGETLKLSPISATAAATLHGRVLNAEGQGIANAVVSIIAEVNDSMGRRQLVTEVATAQTDEHGEYRQEMLSPGTYFLRATVKRAGAASLTIYYPATTDNRAAGPVVLSEAGESIADISIPDALAADTFKISGRVLPLPGKPVETAVQLLLQTRSRPASRVADGSTEEKAGRFEFRGVPSGNYDLFANVRLEDKEYFAKTQVDLVGADLNDVEIVLTPSVDVKGRIVTEGDTVDARAIKISLNRKDGLFGDILIPRFDDAGTGFVFRQVPPGAYSVGIRFSAGDAASQNLYVADVRAGGQSVFDTGLEVGVDATDAVEVVIGTNGGSISGNVVGFSPRQPATVILLPEASRRINSRLFGAVPTNDEGQFEFRGLTPGIYKVVAAPMGAVLSNLNEVIAEYESRAVTVVVQKGMPVNGVQVPLLPPK
jgi:hypothetical protein